MPRIRLTLLVGSYAQNYILGRGTPEDMTERVARISPDPATLLPAAAPVLAHHRMGTPQSLVRDEVLPALRHAVAAALA